MNWGSWENFFAMGGYGLYVWGSVLVSFALLFAEVVVLRAQRASLMKQYTRWLRTSRRRKK